MHTNFKLIKKDADCCARAGELITQHGRLATPLFLPVGTQATVKTLVPGEIKEAGFGMVLSNTYHLYLRPGVDVIEKMGGLHKFMGWDGAILTDSGGYQVFSLSPLRKVSDDGVTFRSHLDGSLHHLTPELIIRYQEVIGADVIMVLDECCDTSGNYAEAEMAVQRTHEWAGRCQKAQRRDDQALYAIVQGGIFPDLRRRSAAGLLSLGFAGYAIGGLSLGEPKELTRSMINETVALLPTNKARYLMGVGSPEDILDGIGRGIDIFDCALPTRVARNGALFTRRGRCNVGNAAFRELAEPIETACGCYTCRTFSAAYLHHLFNSNELLAYRLATIHNLNFIGSLMQKSREAILTDTFASFRDSFLSGYRVTDEEVRIAQKRKWLKSRDRG